MRPRDTTAEADAHYHELLKRLQPHQRLEAAMRLSQAAREMAIAGIRQRHPGLSDQELRIRLAVRLYGTACARRLFGAAVPEDAT